MPAERPANACRYEPGRAGHVESYFLRANDPARPRALWLKATILVPLVGAPVAETWCIWFDGERNRTWAHRETHAFPTASFPAGASTRLSVGDTTFDLSPEGSTRGRLTRQEQSCAWDLTWARSEGAIVAPLSLFPLRGMIDGPFPKSKLLTPFPSLRFRGSVQCFGETVALDDWTGMQGHNWGREHAFEYAWGQCLFPAQDGAPEAMVEGFTGRIRLAGRATPRLSALVVRRGSETYRFDRIFDFWRQQTSVSTVRWTVRLTSSAGNAELTMNTEGRPMVCLGYRNPDGQLSYCFNSKLADTTLRVEPHTGSAFEYRSPHGGALEFLRREPDARFPDIV